MYKVFKDCEQIAIIEKPIYIKSLSDGTFTPATEADCQGIAINSVPYNLFGCSAMDGVTDTVVLCECDGGIEIAKIADSLPGDVISELSRFQNGLGNEYVWHRAVYNVVMSSTQQSRSCGGGAWIYYSDTVKATSSGFEMVNPVEMLYDPAAVSSFPLAGKYFKFRDGGLGGATFKCSNVVLSGSEVIFYGYAVQSVAYDASTASYVNSPNPNAYPISDGYTYTALGQLGDKVQIATGSYTGTGTSGASNPNSLTFDFIPKFVFVSAGNGLVVEPYLWGAASYAVQYNSQTKDNSVTISGSTMSWYSSVDAQRQLNLSGTTYRYIAIG